ncbi:MAG: tRNA nucleotidyltransferase/poly(A) polymerase, partial [Planctomycetota bacterium]
MGGAVRDLVLGLVPKDIDMATNARPEIVEELFESTTAVGRAFGTIVVSLVADQAEHEPRSVDVELTTFRSEGVYKDGRHPDDVSYGATIEEDARRRDFTCNALYLDPLTGQVQDPEEGLKDLKMGRLHCVGDAAQRFQEDGLRLMRLVRFEARYEMKATSETLEGARASKASLGSVSSERVLSELKGIFAAAHPARAIARLAELELIPIALPGFQGLLASDETCTERLSQLKTALESFRGQPSLAAGLALLLEPDMNWSREGSIYS